MIKLIACDMAGTTVDEHADVYRALENCVRETGAEVAPENLQAWMGAEKREAITALITLGGGIPEPALVDATFDRFRELLFSYYQQNPPVALPGVSEAFQSLSAQGIKIALTTGFSRDVATVILEQLGWGVGEGELLDAVVTADEVAAGRPAPYMIHRAMELTGIRDVRSVIAAGDTVNDLQAAKNSGVLAVGVLTGELRREDLEVHAHDVILDSVEQLPQFISHLALKA
ncbi:phosphonatase-like hydrolase [Glutamicibacter sp. NPDC087344]|uniref:phosphonatase-like hydrolase n=1 Tax=Glutamicibacter sp. NPDC087344 TaxID=3363994 RepID=UPI003819CA0B